MEAVKKLQKLQKLALVINWRDFSKKTVKCIFLQLSWFH